jgi:hypothetical protein
VWLNAMAFSHTISITSPRPKKFRPNNEKSQVKLTKKPSDAKSRLVSHPSTDYFSVQRLWLLRPKIPTPNIPMESKQLAWEFHYF